jgi:uncharacterized protein (TIGR01777 family)
MELLNSKVLITGGSGLVGKALTALLEMEGYQVYHLSRNKTAKSARQRFWDPNKGVLDAKDVEGFDVIVHLAGAPIAKKRWTASRKKNIIDSRVTSAQLLYNRIRKTQQKPKLLLSASGIGYYGCKTDNHLYVEGDPPGSDFLGRCCVQWEKSAQQFETLGITTCILRTGVVFSRDGGALKQLLPPINYGLGAPLGSGKQHVPWIHIDDLCQMYLHVIKNNLHGTFNAVAPTTLTNAELTQKIAQLLGKKLWLPNIPAFMLKLMLGEMANMILEGSAVSAQKIVETGFVFQYEKATPALLSSLFPN